MGQINLISNRSISCDVQLLNNSTTEILSEEHVLEQLAAHGPVSRCTVLSARFTIPNIQTVSKRPLKSLKTESFKVISGRKRKATGCYYGLPKQPSKPDLWSEENEDNMDQRYLPQPQLSPTRKLRELNHLKGLIEFRIMKQEQLLHKIKIGKWKSSQVSEKVLYALAKHDLKLLTEEGVNLNSQLANLKTTIE